MPEEDRIYLEEGIVLEGAEHKYRIVQELGHGAFGITYRVEQLDKTGYSTGVFMAMKELFIYSLNGRDGKNVIAGTHQGLFDNLKENVIERIKTFSFPRHENLVSIEEYFSENNTIYYVSKFYDAETLESILRTRGRLSEKETVSVSYTLCSALAHLHTAGLSHLDLKPSNIMITSGATPLLFDYCLLFPFKENIAGETDSELTIESPGYSPIERSTFYIEKGGATEIDVYGLGASMYSMLTGKIPPEASEILNNGFDELPFRDCHVSDKIIDLLKQMMHPMTNKRYSSLNELSEALVATQQSSEIVSEEITEQTSDSLFSENMDQEERFIEKKERRHLHVSIYVMTALLIMTAGLALYFFLLGKTEGVIEKEEGVIDTTAIISPENKDSINALSNTKPYDHITVEESKKDLPGNNKEGSLTEKSNIEPKATDENKHEVSSVPAQNQTGSHEPSMTPPTEKEEPASAPESPLPEIKVEE